MLLNYQHPIHNTQSMGKCILPESSPGGVGDEPTVLVRSGCIECIVEESVIPNEPSHQRESSFRLPQAEVQSAFLRRRAKPPQAKPCLDVPGYLFPQPPNPNAPRAKRTIPTQDIPDAFVFIILCRRLPAYSGWHSMPV